MNFLNRWDLQSESEWKVVQDGHEAHPQLVHLDIQLKLDKGSDSLGENVWICSYLAFDIFDFHIAQFGFWEMSNAFDGQQLLVSRPQVTFECVTRFESSTAIGASERRLPGMTSQVLLHGKFSNI